MHRKTCSGGKYIPSNKLNQRSLYWPTVCRRAVVWCCRRSSQSPTYHPPCCSAQTCPRQHAPVTHTQQNCHCCSCCCRRSDLLPAMDTVNGAKARLAFIILRCTWQKASKHVQQYNKTLTPWKLIYNRLPDSVVLAASISSFKWRLSSFVVNVGFERFSVN